MCDWWFTDDAVLIDTAGRYTTQDSDAAVDKAGWDAFLDLLKRTRARQPLNGVMVAIAVSDIAAAPPRERLAHARAIRRRVKELSRPTRRARAGLCAVHQGRPDRRLHRVLRRPRSREARPGLGHDLPAEQGGSRHRRGLRRRVRPAGAAAERAADRPPCRRSAAPTGAPRSPASRPRSPAWRPPLPSSWPRRSAARGSIRRRSCAASI